jgi:hypothetical protein
MIEKEILEKYRTIAVVGCSRDPNKPAHYVPRYLKEHGYRIIPINPFAEEVLGEKAYPSLLDVPGDIEVVEVFRPNKEAQEIVKMAVEKGAKAVWLQEGIVSLEASRMAREAGIKFVMDKCMMKEHMRYFK